MMNTVESVVNEINDIKKFQQDCERDKNIAMMMQMAEKRMTQATNYTNLIMVAGYAGYFAFWSTLAAKLPNWLYALSGLLALLSLLLFISWEVTKMTWGTVHLNRINKMITETVRGPNALQTIETASSLHNVRINKLWLWFLVPTLSFGIGAGLLLLGYFAVEVWKSVH
ncbi:hypothetical protein [Pseudomonas syringae]|uniref:hypothetical protein n=1 Tax=Pseudomonas syringae TaxID=317 RepID=UPI001BE439AB|nr:hypothetical protein [Pseudomonas syringae]QWB08744.1 hypothetical protein KLC09_09690 [Pseudomonas syringae]